MLPEWKTISGIDGRILPHAPELSDVAMAEISPDGTVLNVNALAEKHWQWRTGDKVSGDLLIALQGIEGESCVLPVKRGGLFLLGVRTEKEHGWMLMGYASEEEQVPDHVSEFKSLLEKMPVLILRMTPEGMVEYASERARITTGYKPEEIIGRPFWHDVVVERDRWKLDEALTTLKDLPQATVTLRITTLYDQVRHTELHLFRVGNGDDAVLEGVVFDVTQQAEVREAELHSEVLYRSFLEQSPVAMLHLDGEGTVTFENHPFRQIVGEAPEDAWIGRNILSLPGLSNNSHTAFTEMLQGGHAFSGSEAFYQGPGRPERQHLLFHGAPIRHPDGHIVGAVLTVEDVTIQRQRDQELTLRTRYSQAETALREAALADPDELEFLRAAAHIMGGATGADRVHLLGHLPVEGKCTTRAVWTPRPGAQEPLTLYLAKYPLLIDLQGASQGLHLTTADADPAHQSLRKLTGAAEAFWTPFFEPGHLAGFVLFEKALMPEGQPTWPDHERTFIDRMTRVLETLWAWILMGNRYRLTVSTIDDGLFNFTFNEDHTRRYLFATHQMEFLTGYTADHILAPGPHALQWTADLVHPADQSLVRAHDATLRSGHESRIVYRVLHRDGTTRWLREHSTPHQDDTGHTTVSGILTDVSEQKAAEEVLLKAKQEAEMSNRLKTSFIATMSHEIRTPLGAVHGYADLLARELEELQLRQGKPMPPQITEFIGAIQDRSSELLTLVSDLFELSNIEMGSIALQRVAIPLHRIIERVTSKLSHTLSEKGIALKVVMSQGHLVVLGDPRRTEQVLDNLLSNALKFTDKGSVTVRAEPVQYEVMVEIQDTGVGISEEYLENLFTPFAQEEDWRNRRFEGTGLGLTLVKRLLDLMGGRIEVESKKGVGSTFRIFLPAARGVNARKRNKGTRSGNVPPRGTERPQA